MEHIQYERLFNIGNFEHEKFIVSKEVEGKELEILKNLAVKIIDFENELAEFRRDCEKINSLTTRIDFYDSMKDKKNLKTAKAEIKKLIRKVKAFRTKHKPVYKECKCYFCQNLDSEYDW